MVISLDMIRSYRGILPRIAVSAYVDLSAQVIGDVVIGERSSVWPERHHSRRRQLHPHRRRDQRAGQLRAARRAERATRCILGNRVTVGHSVTLHGCEIEDECLIGIGAMVLNGAKIGAGSIVAAGALVPEGMQIPPNSVVMGVPGKVRREVTEAGPRTHHPQRRTTTSATGRPTSEETN